MENKFIRVDEVADELGVSRPYAYKLMRQLNEELKEKGLHHHSRAGQPPATSTNGFYGRQKGRERQCRHTRTKSGAHGMRPGVVLRGLDGQERKQKMQAGLSHQAGGPGVGADFLQQQTAATGYDL